MGLFKKEAIIYKDSSDSEQYLAQLERLLPVATGEIKKQLEYDIAATKAGIIGEKRILYELKNSNMDMYVLRDIYLVDGEQSAQIDFYIITPKLNFIIECKNLYGDIEINNKGDFIRTFSYGGRKTREGIYSPITQNERHLQVLRNIKMKDNNIIVKWAIKSGFESLNKSIVVLANPKTILSDRYAPKDVKSKVIRADQLIATLKKICNASNEPSFSQKQMEKAAEKMLQRNVEERKKYIQKYKELEELIIEQKCE